MPRNSSSRTRGSRLLPDDLKLGTVLLAGLLSRRFFTSFNQWLPLSRRAGHGARALFAFALTFLCAGPRWGIRPFALSFEAALNGLVAPVVGLRSLPTASSVSRALGKLSHGEVRTFLDHLLVADAQTIALLDSPHVRHRDATGTGWHVLDFDPTLSVFRQRALVESEAMPDPVRLSPGHRGYTGHKRRELRIRHLPLQHAGSSVWLAYRLDASGDNLLPLLAEMVGAGKKILDRVSPGDIVVRADGEFGSVGAMRTLLAAQMHVLTRLCRYALLDREEVQTAMAAARWDRVASSGSGPAREAADLGLFTLHPDPKALDADVGPVEVRVVVSRFPRSGPAEHGVVRGGFQVELFATSLPANAWPAADVVTLYFGRSAMENRFAQEDREIDMDRTFSFHPPGQEWMSGIGLFLWNVLVGRGVAATPLPPELPSQVARESEEQVTKSAPAESVAESAAIQQESLEEAGGVVEAAEADHGFEAVEAVHAGQAHIVTAQADVERNEEREIRRNIWEITKQAFDKSPPPIGWTIDETRGELRCPNGNRLFPFSAETDSRMGATGICVKHRIILRTEIRVCNGCPFRSECASSQNPNTYKEISRAVPSADAPRLHALLDEKRKFAQKEQVRRMLERREAENPAPAPALLPAVPLVASPHGLTPGPLLPLPALFLPAASRAFVRECLRNIEVEVRIVPRMVRPQHTHPFLAATTAERRHERITWKARDAHAAFAGDATLTIGGGKGLSPRMRRKITKSLAL